jgi:hypothetical protein
MWSLGLACFAVACGGDSKDPSKVEGAETHEDGGPRGDNGCTTSEETLTTLPDQLDALPGWSPRQAATAASGKWTNTERDTLDLASADAGTFHLSTGTRQSSGGGPGPCSADTFVAVPTHVTLVTQDGRFDEQFDTELRLQGRYAFLKIELPLDSLAGTFRPEGPNDGMLGFSGDFGFAEAGWTLSGSVQGAPSGAGSGSSEVVYLAPFEIR